jgi:hypothetical protein
VYRASVIVIFRRLCSNFFASCHFFAAVVRTTGGERSTQRSWRGPVGTVRNRSWLAKWNGRCRTKHPLPLANGHFTRVINNLRLTPVATSVRQKVKTDGSPEKQLIGHVCSTSQRPSGAREHQIEPSRPLRSTTPRTSRAFRPSTTIQNRQLF